MPNQSPLHQVQAGLLADKSNGIPYNIQLLNLWLDAASATSPTATSFENLKRVTSTSSSKRTSSQLHASNKRAVTPNRSRHSRKASGKHSLCKPLLKQKQINTDLSSPSHIEGIELGSKPGVRRVFSRSKSDVATSPP